MAKPEETPQEPAAVENVAVDAPVEQATETDVAATAAAQPEAEASDNLSLEKVEDDATYGEAGDSDDDAPVVDAEEAPLEEDAVSKDKRPVRYALVGLAVGIFVGFCCNFAVTGIQDLIKSSSATAITVAVADCNLDGRDGISVTESNKRLLIDTKGSADDAGASTQNAVCLVQALQVPEEVLAKLNETKPDGQSHKEEWDKREITWEFSGDKGIKMDILIKS